MKDKKLWIINRDAFVASTEFYRLTKYASASFIFRLKIENVGSGLGCAILCYVFGELKYTRTLIRAHMA